MHTLSPRAANLLAALRANVEGSETIIDADVFRDVYLDNARPADMSPRTFAATLSELSRAGLYRPIDEFAFGMVATGDKRQ